MADNHYASCREAAEADDRTPPQFRTSKKLLTLTYLHLVELYAGRMTRARTKAKRKEWQEALENACENLKGSVLQ